MLVRLGVYFAIMKLTSVDGQYYLSAAKSRLKVYTNNFFLESSSIVSSVLFRQGCLTPAAKVWELDLVSW